MMSHNGPTPGQTRCQEWRRLWRFSENTSALCAWCVCACVCVCPRRCRQPPRSVPAARITPGRDGKPTMKRHNTQPSHLAQRCPRSRRRATPGPATSPGPSPAAGPSCPRGRFHTPRRTRTDRSRIQHDKRSFFCCVFRYTEYTNSATVTLQPLIPYPFPLD